MTTIIGQENYYANSLADVTTSRISIKRSWTVLIAKLRIRES